MFIQTQIATRALLRVLQTKGWIEVLREKPEGSVGCLNLEGDVIRFSHSQGCIQRQ